jgi:type I restriction enzyme S subunit
MSNSPTPNPKSAENHFFEHFATLATAPDGITRLRELILQLAVQGKLGTNNPTESPLKIDESKKRIRKAKSQNGDSNKTQIIDIFPPDSISKNWRKTTLGSVGVWSTGGTPSRREVSYFDGDIPWIKSGDLNDGIVTKTDETISQSGLNNSNAKIMPKGTISIALYGATIGKLGILGIEAATNQACANCVINEKIITSRYLFYFLRSQKSYFIQVGQGGAQPNITNWIIWEWPIVIPPLAEQHRIVAKVDRLMALCNELEARQQEERAGCLRLGTASLVGLQNAESPEEFKRQWAQVCDAFDLILDCPENVAVLRQTILQLAVQGRLVRQEPGNEPATVLLDAIRKEKDRLVKDGKLPKERDSKFVNGDDVPFKIPKEWLWTYFGQITFNRDGARIPIEKAERATRHGAYDYYGASGVIDTIDDYLFDKPLLLVGEDGANLVNRSTPIAFIAHGKYWVNNHAHVLDGISLEFLRYLEVYINSIDLRPYLTGMAQPKMNQAKMNSIPVPLPPLAEQHRIVAKVDALMALCDALEARLKEQAGIQTKFADAVVKNVGTG